MFEHLFLFSYTCSSFRRQTLNLKPRYYVHGYTTRRYYIEMWPCSLTRGLWLCWWVCVPGMWAHWLQWSPSANRVGLHCRARRCRGVSGDWGGLASPGPRGWQRRASNDANMPCIHTDISLIFSCPKLFFTNWHHLLKACGVITYWQENNSVRSFTSRHTWLCLHPTLHWLVCMLLHKAS